MNDEKRAGSEWSDPVPQGPLDRPVVSPTSPSAVNPLSDSSDTGTDDDTPMPAISADMQRFIGRQLRAVYDDVAKQPVPDRFLELMKQLETKAAR